MGASLSWPVLLMLAEPVNSRPSRLCSEGSKLTVS
jgi:hypothetical protein